MTGTIREVFQNGEALRQHLDDLNERGEHPVAVGVDALGLPFLITLVGPYAESEDVMFDSPWQADLDHGRAVDGKWVPHPPRCEECQAQVYGIDDIRYPVTVLVVTRLEAVRRG